MLPDLLKLSRKGFFPFMKDIDEDDAYHVYVPRPYSLVGTIKKQGRHFKSPSELSFLDNQPQQPHPRLK